MKKILFISILLLLSACNPSFGVSTPLSPMEVQVNQKQKISIEIYSNGYDLKNVTTNWKLKQQNCGEVVNNSTNNTTYTAGNEPGICDIEVTLEDKGVILKSENLQINVVSITPTIPVATDTAIPTIIPIVTDTIPTSKIDGITPEKAISLGEVTLTQTNNSIQIKIYDSNKQPINNDKVECKLVFHPLEYSGQPNNCEITGYQLAGLDKQLITVVVQGKENSGIIGKVTRSIIVSRQ